MTHDNTPDSRDLRHEVKVSSELEQRGPSVFPLADAVTAEDNRDALAVVASAEDIPLESLLERLNRNAWTSDERILFNLLALRRPLREISFAMGETKETLPKPQSVPEDTLISWARAYLEESARKRAEVERRRHYGGARQVVQITAPRQAHGG